MSLVQLAPTPGATYPTQPLLHLDSLWIQVAGTLCNIACSHCFVSSGPGNDRHPLMSREEVRTRVAEAVSLGVKELYFTGGEPFLHPEMIEILDDSLRFAPSTVLTNGTLFTRRRLERLRALSDSARYTLELRVSLDGSDAATHDAVRGAGAFERTLEGLRQCEALGLLPIVTATRGIEEDPEGLRRRYLAMLRDAGLRRPRLKLIPLFLLGREPQRSRPYGPHESLADLPEGALDPARLQCSSCRAVSARGVYVCPLLVEEPGGRMADRLADALTPFTLRHGACHTCYVTGMTCGNA